MLDHIDVMLIEECLIAGMTDNQIRDAYGFSIDEISYAEFQIFKREEVTYD